MLGFANQTMTRWPNGRFAAPGERWGWNYELGVLLDGMDAVWRDTRDPAVYKYIRSSMDSFLTQTGEIRTYSAQANELDNILLGRQLLLLYRTSHDARYASAAAILYRQLQQQPRSPSGGFWHKERYPDQMWLDGLYMAEPFYAEYARSFGHPEALRDVTRQFLLIQQHAFDPRSGLLYHGWDESKRQSWADPRTGTSSQFWARAMGWYMMALVDTLPYYPKHDPDRKKLIAILRLEAVAIAKYQGANSGVWFQVMDKENAPGNYAESSASAMFIYALAKGVRMGYLPKHDLEVSRRGYDGLVQRFVRVDANCTLELTGTVKSAGLGGNPYRDGSYRYYTNEKVVTNDPKGIGAFLLASAELARISASRAR